MKSNPICSIIICTYNRADLLKQTLLSLKHVKGIEDSEVIVVDNNSKDHTKDIVHQCTSELRDSVKITYVFQIQQGLSIARNTGVKAAQSDVIAFLDDDAVPEPIWLNTIVDTFMQYPEILAIGGKIEPVFEQSRPPWLISALEKPYTIVDLGKHLTYYKKNMHPYGANMAMRKSLFDKYQFPLELGRKGNMLLSGEESWLFEQVRSNSGKMAYVPNMKVRHFIPAERLTKKWIKQRYYYQGVSRAYASSSVAAKIHLKITLFLRSVYILLSSLFAHSEGSRLLITCRKESVRGTKVALKGEV
ncbi:glycosyltransferase [Longirhabdus pacifica]|uniref:glycosyltransferase n=1 Tax=Longirhabdus pacifica TaxID=2305227 RepID=UPI001008E3A7|nr:glycosyltransferase [Longirhabdus pacifica]